jgi:hypothetical protein
MDIVSRLILFLCLCSPVSVFAAITYTVTQFGNGTTTFTGSGGSVQLAADAWAANLNTANWARCRDAYGNVLSKYTVTVTGVSGNTVSYTLTAPAVPNASGCSAYSTSGTVTATQTGEPDPVVCGPNQERDPETNTCDCKSVRNAGSFMVSGDVFQGCNAGCSMVLQSGWYDKAANTTWGSWSQTGGSCSPGEPSVLSSADPKVEAAKQCAAGTCPGTINGESRCVPCDKTKQTQSTSSSTSSSSTASGATSSTTTSESGSEASQTSCKDGSCTTTTTTTTVGPNGDKVDKTTTKTEPQSDYCTQNPKAPVCKGSESSWGGSCGSFSCDGDAVTCAIAQASWKSACAIDIDETDPKVTAGNAAMSGGDRPGDHPGNTPEQNAFTANIDQTNPFGSECPADISLDVMGQSVAIPLTHACDSLKFMGQIAVAFAMCAAAFIVFGGIKG